VNEQFQKYREIALGILKPSPADLERGLKLHANALIIEPYGSAPQTAVDVDILRTAQDEGSAREEVFDLHRDMIRTGAAIDPVERDAFTDSWDASGVTCIVQGGGSLDQDPERHFKSMARFLYLTDKLGDYVRRAVTPDDILEAKAQNCRSLYMALCNVPLPLRWDSVEGELRYIQTFFNLGVRMMHLTYNRCTMLGEGCSEPTDGELSDLGRAAIAEMNRVGVIVDVAHASH
jgi:membrane dipeptidase